MKTIAKPPYTEQSWTTAGTYTWTCPVGVTRVRVAVCGGGGGSAVFGYNAGVITDACSNGSSSSAFGISATGGGIGNAEWYRAEN